MYLLEHQKMIDSLAIVKVKSPSLLLKLNKHIAQLTAQRRGAAAAGVMSASQGAPPAASPANHFGVTGAPTAAALAVANAPATSIQSSSSSSSSSSALSSSSSVSPAASAAALQSGVLSPQTQHQYLMFPTSPSSLYSTAQFSNGGGGGGSQAFGFPSH